VQECVLSEHIMFCQGVGVLWCDEKYEKVCSCLMKVCRHMIGVIFGFRACPLDASNKISGQGMSMWTRPKVVYMHVDDQVCVHPEWQFQR
jgi:hypothetical protein